MEKQIRIYIVDDDEFSLNMYGQFLKNSGFQNIELFNDGEKCYRRLNDRPDLIFLDHLMDEISGMDLLQKVRKWDPSIPVVVVSGQENIRTAVNYIKQGACDYIIKGDEELLRMKTIAKKIGEKHALKPSKPTFGIDSDFLLSMAAMLIFTEIPLILALIYFKAKPGVVIASSILVLFLVCIFNILKSGYRAHEDGSQG